MAQRIDVQYIQFYTHGNAAQHIAPANPVKNTQLPHTQKRRVQRIYVDPVATLGIVVAVCMLVMMTVGVFRLQKEQRETAQLEQYVTLLEQRNQELQAQYEQECDLEEIEKTALALGMIPKEQATHVVIQVELPSDQVAEQESLWSRIGTFLTGLFA